MARITIKPVHNSHSWDPKFEAVLDRWSLFRGSVYKKIEIGTFKWWPL